MRLLMKNILVVLDGSSSDEHVLEQAIQLTANNGGDIHLSMTVYDSIEELRFDIHDCPH